MRVQLVAKPGRGMTGTSRYAENLHRGLLAAGVDVSLTYPEPFPPGQQVRRGLRRLGLDADAFFATYPLRLRLAGADVVHLTTQTMGALLMAQRFDRPVVVTVLDIIPWLVRRDPALNTFRHPLDAAFYRLALAGLRRADRLIAISNWTRQTLVEQVGISPDKVEVIYPGVDLDRFRPMPVPAWFYAKYGLDRATRYVLYVGSDDPRKNLRLLVAAFAHVREAMDGLGLLLVGGGNGARLGPGVRRFAGVPDEDLALFYNAAAVCVLPSLYEGFGLPALEAMACGCPVLASRATALPEVTGGAAALVDAGEAGKLSGALCDLLADGGGLAQAGQAQARRFSLAKCAQDVRALYARCGLNTDG